jgi:NitT/TauT family transport system substrate-binding protein
MRAGHETGPRQHAMAAVPAGIAAVLAAGVVTWGTAAGAQQCSGPLRRINIGVAASPPNVVHTSPYVAKALGFFGKRCIDANIVQFEGGLSPASVTAVAQGGTLSGANEIGIGRGLKVTQVWALAQRLPQVYMVAESVRTAADLKGRKLSATGGGIGGFQWRIAREILKSAGLDTTDANFINAATAGRVPGLVTGQIDGVALAPEDAFLARQQKPSVNSLLLVADLLPHFMYNAYGASLDWIARDRPLIRDAVAAMIEANRAMFTDRAKVLPVVIEATQKPKDAVEYALDFLTKTCIWSVNHGLDEATTAWNIDNSVGNGDLDAAKKPAIAQVADFKLAEEAVAEAGGRVTLGTCAK